MSGSPVVVVGAGPVGLAAAAQLLELGVEPLVLECGAHAGAAVAQWNHVRLFSRWSELVDPAGGRLLLSGGWQHPDENSYPTGEEWVSQYLRPLARALGARVQFGARVVGLARRGRDRVVDAGRDSEPLTVHVRRPGKIEERLTASGLIDASGTWGTPNPLGGDGLPAVGEAAAARRIAYRVPDLNKAMEHERYMGRHVVIVGSGHSALTALVAFTDLVTQHSGTRVTWLLRRDALGDTFGGGESDQLSARAALGLQAKAALEAGRVTLVTGFRTDLLKRDSKDRLVLISDGGQRVEAVDEVVVLTGFRPDLSWLSEVRLELDVRLQAPAALAPLIDPNVHYCGTVLPHGVNELGHPEPGVFLAGMKSYGRAPTFLAKTGYEQVRSIAAAFAGDHAAAEQVELKLPETAVCSAAERCENRARATDGECCGTSADPQPLTLSASSSRP